MSLSGHFRKSHFLRTRRCMRTLVNPTTITIISTLLLGHSRCLVSSFLKKNFSINKYILWNLCNVKLLTLIWSLSILVYWFHYIYYHGQESFRRNGGALILKKRIQNALLWCNLKNYTIILIGFQVKPFNIIEIQIYAPTTNAEEAELKWFYEDLHVILELTPKKISFSS